MGIGIGTRYCTTSFNLSLSASDSDSFLYYLTQPVPICPGFGLVPEVTHSTCPYLPRFRTRSLSHTLNLSLSTPDSDSFLYYLTQPVPICLGFGLVPALPHSTCPYLPRIRTRFCTTSLNLSLFAPDSDSFLYYLTQPVPICLGFGLVSVLPHSTCPYQPWIRTRFCSTSLNPSLSAPAIRTRSCTPSFSLSESTREQNPF